MATEDKLQELGITLPALPAPAGNYVHAVRTGNLLFLAGKGPIRSKGKVGAELSTREGYLCAREVGLVLLAVLRSELGTLDRVAKVVKVMGLVNATPDFAEHPQVMNGCSDLFVSVFGDRGRHARTSIGVASLPNQIPVEIEAVIEVGD